MALKNCGVTVLQYWCYRMLRVTELWCYNIKELLSHGIMVIRGYSGTVLQCYGVTIIWHYYGITMALWHYGITTTLQCYIIAELQHYNVTVLWHLCYCISVTTSVLQHQCYRVFMRYTIMVRVMALGNYGITTLRHYDFIVLQN
jgi:hypothetical protein